MRRVGLIFPNNVKWQPNRDWRCGIVYISYPFSWHVCIEKWRASH